MDIRIFEYVMCLIFIVIFLDEYTVSSVRDKVSIWNPTLCYRYVIFKLFQQK